MPFHSSSHTSVSYLLSEVSISLPNTKFSVSLSRKEEMVTQKYLNNKDLSLSLRQDCISITTSEQTK